MAIFKRGNTYWFEFKFNGVRIRESTKQKNRIEARKIEADRKTQLAKREVGIKEKKKAPAFVDFQKRFLAWVSAESAAKPKTVQFYHNRVAQLLKYPPLKSAKVDEIDMQFVADYISYRRGTKVTRAGSRKSGKIRLVSSRKPVSVATLNRDLATLRRLLNVALEWKVIETVPKIRLLNGEKNRERVLTHDEEAAYLAVASPLLQDYAILALDTGMGPQELLDTRYENVHFEPAGDAQYGYVHVPVGKAEKRKRNLPMTQRVRKVLSERYASAGQPKWGWVFQGKSEAPVTYDTIDCQHDRVMKKRFQGEELELNRWRLYDMRHTYLTRLGESNADAFTIKKLAGHASILTSQRYVHPTDDRVEDAITRLEAYNAAKRERTKTA